jgi:ABC-type bacteriocin/lantibiotic exporter with double-glycine peptidase domain
VSFRHSWPWSKLASKLDRIDDVFDTPPEARGTVVKKRLDGAITFEGVSFRYGPKSPLILDDVSFHVAPRERVALVGRSGSGKSTLLKLVLGVLSPTSGRVLIDSVPVSEYDPTELRRRIGTVLAEGAFVSDTILENVALGAEHADAEAVRRAADAACVDEVIRALPDGYQTVLDSGARQLSGGQRQRLHLARALAKEPNVLLLDEASSSLDPELQDRIHASMDVLECTMLLVAHNASALRLANRILVLDAGKIVQEGTYASLSHEKSTFTDLIQSAL